MIEDTSIAFDKTTSWNDLSASVMLPRQPEVAPPVQTNSERALIVYENADASSAESEVAQLLSRAHVVLPAVMNYLYFNSNKVAVVYFGKRTKDGQKFGIKEGAEDFKIRMIRYLTSEIWPTVLRTDAPDESLVNEVVAEQSAATAETVQTQSSFADIQDTAADAKTLKELRPDISSLKLSAEELTAALSGQLPSLPLTGSRYSEETAQELLWFKKSLESRMQALIYLKKGASGSRYLKVVLNNSAQRVYFDVTDPKEEKYRWDMRMLYTRLMDNLETQKAIESYESYEASFRLACATAAAYAVELERPVQSMTPVTVWGGQDPRTQLFLGVQDALITPGETSGSESGAMSTASSAAAEDLSVPRADRGHSRSRSAASAAPAPSSAEVSAKASRSGSEEGNGRAAEGLAEEQNSAPLRGPALPFKADQESGALSARTRGTKSNPSGARSYRWMENLQRPESATLDYKSYFSHTAGEIKSRCVKFMCGFLNAYREGKLVIGVHELPRRDADGNAETTKGGKNNIILHNDLIDQNVVGVLITESELEDVQEDVSQQLLCCVPPIPPQTVSIDVIPVVFPVNLAYSTRVLVLCEDASCGFTREALKQKSNYAIRFLNPLGLSIIPLAAVDEQLAELVSAHHASTADDAEESKDSRESREGKESADDASPAASPAPASLKTSRAGTLKAEAYIVAAISDPAKLTATNWEADLGKALGGPKTRCKHFFAEFPVDLYGPLTLPQLHVVEVSVDIKRCGFAPLKSYKGKFFSGWPSIPIWNVSTRSVRRAERNYTLFSGTSAPLEAWGPLGSARSQSILHAVADAHKSPSTGQAPDTQSPLTYLNASANHGSFQRAMSRNGWAWFTNHQIVNVLVSSLYSQTRVHDVLQFRLVHPVWNRVFENHQGIPLLYMIKRTPIGVPMFTNGAEHISRVQYAFLHAGIPPMPLFLCRVYEIIGSLPSPYPFVSVPLVQQSFRVSPFLIPLFYRQHYFDGMMRISVVIDLRDGVLKTMQLRDGNLVLEAIVGMCFEKMNKRQVTRQLEQLLLKEENPSAALQPQHARVRSTSGSAAREGGSHRRRQHHDAARPSHDSKNFLARRTLQPRMLTQARSSCRSASVLSPMVSESCRMTSREVESDIPLIHFRFLTRKLLADGVFVVPDVTPPPPPPSPSPPAMAPPGSEEIVTADDPQAPSPPVPPMGRPWTLQHLLSWYNALLTDDKHVRCFGYCDRSLAFHVTDFTEVCADDVEVGALDLAAGKDLHFAADRQRCTLHQKVLQWMEI